MLISFVWSTPFGSVFLSLFTDLNDVYIYICVCVCVRVSACDYNLRINEKSHSLYYNFLLNRSTKQEIAFSTRSSSTQN